jgi:3-hydroxyisobutyrate dehydrogenase-like beta-hydroxyacid dehydrogenase
MRVGFIGLGNMGTPVARRIVDGGHETTLWARRREALEPFAGTGATFASDAAGVAREADVVGLCVTDDAGVEALTTGPGGLLDAMRPQSVLILLSTIHPRTCRGIGEAAAERGVEVLDTPVSGGPDRAGEGRLVVMVGGEEATYRRCVPVLSCFGDPIVHVGALGCGQLAKLVNNVVYMANFALVESAMGAGDGLGIDRDAMGVVLANGSGQSYALDIYRRFGGIAGISVRARGLLRKDLHHMTTFAGEPGLEPLEPLLRQAEALVALFGAIDAAPAPGLNEAPG